MNEKSLTTRPQSDPISPDIHELAGLIKAMLPNGSKLTDQEALAGAMYGKAHNLNPFKGEYYIVPGKGIYPGYRGEMALRNDRDFYTQFRPLLGDEAAEHDIQPGDSARICELYQPDLMAHVRALGVIYRPILGIGIVRKAEKWITEEWTDTPNGRRKIKLDHPRPAEPPTGRSWAWKAEQRAYKDALRHMQGGSDILNETMQDRLDDADQQAAAITAEFTALVPDEQQARFTSNVEMLRGPKFAGFGDEDSRPGVTESMEGELIPPDNGHDMEAEFAAIPSAQEERAGAIPTPDTMTNKPTLLAWAMSTGAFEHENHAANAWDVLKREMPADTKFPAFRSAWIADVRRRVAERQAKLITDEEAPA